MAILPENVFDVHKVNNKPNNNNIFCTLLFQIFCLILLHFAEGYYLQDAILYPVFAIWCLCIFLLHCALSLAAQCYCNRSCLWVCLFVGLLSQLKIACIDLHQTGSVGEGSDHVQLIKILALLHPREGGLQRGGNFWLRLTTASAQCLHLSEHFFITFGNCCELVFKILVVK